MQNNGNGPGACTGGADRIHSVRVACERFTGTGEREFLMQQRTLDGEQSRLKRMMSEFEHGFHSLCNLGPAVTVFGSARFRSDHPNYELGRTGGEWAREIRIHCDHGCPGIMDARTVVHVRQRGAFL